MTAARHACNRNEGWAPRRAVERFDNEAGGGHIGTQREFFESAFSPALSSSGFGERAVASCCLSYLLACLRTFRPTI